MCRIGYGGFSIRKVTLEELWELSDKNGNVLHIIPGQGYKYYEKPEYVILTNFSPFKGNSEKHPWMGMDRYQTAKELLSKATGTFQILQVCTYDRYRFSVFCHG